MTEKHIILVHFSSVPGGIEVLSPQIIDNFPQHKFSVFVIRLKVEGKANVYEGIDIPITYGADNNLRAVWRLYKYARSNRNCIFHVFNIGPVFLLLLKAAGVRHLIYSIHGTKYWKNIFQKFVLKRLWRLAMHKKYRLTSNSLFSGDIFRNEVLSGREISLLYNPIDNGRFKPLQGSKQKSIPRKIIYLGRLDKGKNLDIWIRTAVSILKKFQDIIFEIYGDGPECDTIREQVNNSGFSDNIILKGYTENPEKALQEADLTMFLSQYESFGNVVVESILCGTPVIAGDIPSMKEIFGDFPEFLISLEGNVAEAVIQKLKDTDSLNRRCAEARQDFLVRFSPEKHFEKLNALYSVIR